MKAKLEDQLDKMGPRLSHCVDRFVSFSDLAEFEKPGQEVNLKPQIKFKTFLMIKNF